MKLGARNTLMKHLPECLKMLHISGYSNRAGFWMLISTVWLCLMNVSSCQPQAKTFASEVLIWYFLAFNNLILRLMSLLFNKMSENHFISKTIMQCNIIMLVLIIKCYYFLLLLMFKFDSLWLKPDEFTSWAKYYRYSNQCSVISTI